MDGDDIKVAVEARKQRYRRELEDFFRRWIVDGYALRANEQWHRDYTSAEAYERSVVKNRERWRMVLKPPELAAAGELEAEPVAGLEDFGGCFVRLPLSGGLRAEGILVIPRATKEPVPLVVAQHGLGSSPESVLGLDGANVYYHQYGRRLVEAGFAVLAPFNLSGSDERGRIGRLASLIDTTLTGLEFIRMQRLLDVLLMRPELDQDRVGFWGLSLGGMAAQFWAPLETRLKVIISSGWFNARLPKMVLPDPRYSCFLETEEEHAFLRGWLTEFSDSDLLSLVCPRPFLIQHGKADDIAWWPLLIEEFKELKSHYDRLGLADQVALDLHEGWHEARVGSGIAWLQQWL